MNSGCIIHGVRPNWMSVDNRDCHWLSQSEIGDGKRIYRHLIGCSWQTIALFFRVFLRLFVFRASYTAIG
jgi:hypothetical protein